MSTTMPTEGVQGEAFTDELKKRDNSKNGTGGLKNSFHILIIQGIYIDYQIVNSLGLLF